MIHSKDFLRLASFSASTVALGLFKYHWDDDDIQKHERDDPFLKANEQSSINLGIAQYRKDIVDQKMQRTSNYFENVTFCTPNSSHTDSHVQKPMQTMDRNDDNDTRKIIQFSSAMTRTQFILYKLSILNDKTLPVPRLLSSNDPIFTYHKMKRGLKQRERDEEKLRNMQSEITALVEKQRQQNSDTKQEENMSLMTGIMEKISEIAYGKGITPQMREDFLIKHGCTAYSTSILDTIIQYSANHGIIEIGAGNGQWAKAISDHHQTLLNSSSIPPSPLQQFIVAYDDMSHIPLNTQVYHKYTQPAQEYFFPNVQKMKGQDAVGFLKNRGRVLLLVYPPPGKMAIEVVKQYTKFDGNDTVIYVGEGVGGANGDKEFFDYFLNKEAEGGSSIDENGKYKWYVMETADIEDVLGGGKGFERLFVLRRFKVGGD